MNEVLKDKLSYIASDSLALQALDALFNERIEKEKPVVERSDTDEVVGQKYRAYNQAKELLKETLKDIEAYKDKKVDKPKIDKSK